MASSYYMGYNVSNNREICLTGLRSESSTNRLLISSVIIKIDSVNNKFCVIDYTYLTITNQSIGYEAHYHTNPGVESTAQLYLMIDAM